ncbi:MAG: redox-regulated ATPase YchF [Candidatus Aminicenantia bacterium]
MKFTIFGYPKTGKTTLFNILTGAEIEVKKYEKEEKEPNIRTCDVPDNRLDKISALFPEKKKVYASIDYTDLAGLSWGKVKSSLYLNYLRTADGLTHVVRGFRDPEILHPQGEINPPRDIQNMEEELILSDLIVIDSRLEKIEHDLKRKKDPEEEKEKELLTKIKFSLNEEKAIRELDFSFEEEKIIRGFTFLTHKPLLHLINLDEKDIEFLENPEKFYPLPKKGVKCFCFCGTIEKEILELENEEKELFLKEYGLKELSINKFLRVSYELLDLISFFTIGKEEVRAWTIPRGTIAQKAAGTIHTDMEKGFIKAEVIPWDELVNIGSLKEAKDKGMIRLEGKDYLVQDGDVIYFRFSK